MWDALVGVWNWMRANDLPNWLAVAFTAIVWPLVLVWLHYRKKGNVPGLEVTVQPGSITISGKPHAAVTLNFINHTESVAYITAPSIYKCTKAFAVTSDSARDITTSVHHLKFLAAGGGPGLLDREITLQTKESRSTAVAVDAPLPDEFYRYRVPRWRRVLRQPKYFVLEYVAMVGTTRHNVSTAY